MVAHEDATEDEYWDALSEQAEAEDFAQRYNTEEALTARASRVSASYPEDTDAGVIFEHEDEDSVSRVRYSEPERLIQCYVRTCGWDEAANVGVSLAVSSEDFLNGLGTARLGKKASLKDVSGLGILMLADGGFSINVRDAVATWWGSADRFRFDQLFLDTFSIVENEEPRRRQTRDVTLSTGERALVRVLLAKPDHFHGMDPRAFEVSVAIILKEIGFSKVKLSRYTRDGGVDIWAFHCVGEKEETVVVEVKHRRGGAIGLSVVDRLNGVRDRENAQRGMVVTNSYFSADARGNYAHKASTMSLIDFESLVDLLKACGGQWSVTPSGLWTTRRKQDDGTQKKSLPNKGD